MQLKALYTAIHKLNDIDKALIFLYLDFVGFIRHYVGHKVKWLWYFHMTHHLATRLTPLTRTREHPVYHIYSMSTRVLLAYPGSVFIFSLVGANSGASDFVALVLALVLFQFNLHIRHTPFRVSYGALEVFLMSPFMHQVHHSKLSKHHDKNFGVALSIWDRLAGTLYVPLEDEELIFGVETPFKESGQITSGFHDLMLPYFLIKEDLVKSGIVRSDLNLKKNSNF